MCLFSLVFQTIPDCPVFLFANREESIHRPSAPPAVWESSNPQGHWLGGTDLKAGGTWLGINRAGVIVAVTNRRKALLPLEPKSRGLLCRELLEQGSWEAAYAQFHRQWNTQEFAGFNLMLISAERGLIVSAGDDFQVQSLTPGTHAITNRDWNDPHDPRIARVRGLMEQFQQTHAPLEAWIEQAKSICGLEEESDGDAVCIPCTTGWGTVSSSLIALTSNPQKARFLHANGSLPAAPFDDYSSQLTFLLEPSP